MLKFRITHTVSPDPEKIKKNSMRSFRFLSTCSSSSSQFSSSSGLLSVSLSLFCFLSLPLSCHFSPSSFLLVHGVTGAFPSSTETKRPDWSCLAVQKVAWWRGCLFMAICLFSCVTCCFPFFFFFFYFSNLRWSCGVCCGSEKKCRTWRWKGIEIIIGMECNRKKGHEGGERKLKWGGWREGKKAEMLIKKAELWRWAVKNRSYAPPRGWDYITWTPRLWIIQLGPRRLLRSCSLLVSIS